MTSSVSSLNSVQAFCQHSNEIDSEPAAANIAKEIFSTLAHSSISEKWGVIRRVRTEFSKKNADAERVDALKLALCEGTKMHWKDRLLGAYFEQKLDLHYLHFEYSNKLSKPIELTLPSSVLSGMFGTENQERQFDSRSTLFLSSPFAAVFGSTFATNKKDRISKKGNYVLDAAFAAECQNSDGKSNGFAMAVSDGGGGHFGDVTQDRNIANAAHAAVKSCVRFLSAYQTADELKNDISVAVKNCAGEVRRRGKGESATLVGCRVFLVDEQFRVVGFNVGDGMLVSWDPSKNTFRHHLPSRVTQAGTALLPDAYKPFELHTFDTTLPKGAFLFLMTDGVHDTLPFEEVEKTYENGLGYRERTLTEANALLEGISLLKLEADYLKLLAEKSFAGAEQLRQSCQDKKKQQIGDDFALLQCRL